MCVCVVVGVWVSERELASGYTNVHGTLLQHFLINRISFGCLSHADGGSGHQKDDKGKEWNSSHHTVGRNDVTYYTSHSTDTEWP